MYACVHAHMCACVGVCFVHVYMCVYACTYVYVHVRMCACVCVFFCFATRQLITLLPSVGFLLD